jgi:hypothetical protein
MSLVDKTLSILHALYYCNDKYQPVDFLKSIQLHTMDDYTCIKVDQGVSKILCYIQDEKAMLLLWAPIEYTISYDDVLPHVDLQDPYRQWVVPYYPNTMPTSILVGERGGTWSIPWLATAWWPIAGVTDAIDDPHAWLRWWWSEVMEHDISTCPELESFLEHGT